MAVPKKRKKLAEISDDLRKKKPGQRKTKKPGKASKTSTRHSTKKIDTAFDIMQHIENDDEFPEDEVMEKNDSMRQGKPASSSSPSKRQGFRFQISLDALMPDNKSQDEDHESSPVKKSPLLDIGVTIPFFWKFPVIGRLAQKVVRNIKTIKF